VHISFAVFADAANLSQEGKLNVLGIFDALQVGAFPSVHPRAHFVIRLKGSAADVGKHMLSFRWVNPRGTELWNSTGELELAAAPDATMEMDLPVIAVVDLPLDAGGRYAMHVDLDGAPVSLIHLFVNGPTPALPVTARGDVLPS
jgi:hypothetical protein